MKFLAKLREHYKVLGVDVPDWLNENNITGTPVGAAPASNTPVASTPAGSAPQSIVNQFLNATKIMDGDPDIDKIKATVAQKVTDAKKTFTDVGTKVVDTISKTLQGLNTIASSSQTQDVAAAGAPTGVQPSTGAVSQIGVK